MSLAGRRSNQGDQYQLRIALHWLIRLLSDDSIEAIQVDSTGIPGREYPMTVDDIVIIYRGDKTRYIQAKKNQPTYRAWNFSDLKEELIKVRDQLKNDPHGEVEFYSRDDFGDFRILVETCQLIPSYDAFLQEANEKHYQLLGKFSKIINCANEESFSLAKRVSFGPLHNFDGWDEENLRALNAQVPRAKDALAHLYELIASHESSLAAGSIQITRTDVVSKLQEHGLSPTPERSIAEILKSFSISSQIGRNWIRTVGDIAIPRPELDKIVRFIEEGKKSILLTEGAGSGKTCLLLDLASYIEDARSVNWGLLFIKGDQFLSAQSESDLVDKGLPDDIVGRCARLAENRRVVVIIDSLDVLSLSRQHDSLKLFMGLINRLTRIPNVTTVAACRTFDLDYDPLLRGMKWDGRVSIQPLNFESTIVPILKCWEVDPNSLSQVLKELLRIPQNLRLYKKIVDSGFAPQVTSAYDLCNSFMQEVIVKKDSLGDNALKGLYRMVEYLKSYRSQYCNRDALGLDENIIRELISQEVLYAEPTGAVTFGHQTLADCLTVRAAIAHQQTLQGFILSQPQLPFIRPFVRAFFFHLRAHQPDQFSRQVAQVLSEGAVSYHVKRLICESLAEIKPTKDDRRLFRRLYQLYPSLLKRTLIRIEVMGSIYGEDWFLFLSENWLPLVHSSASDQKSTWLRLFVQAAKCWMNKLPEETVSLWYRAVEEGWFEYRVLAKLISNQMMYFNFMDIEGIRAILEHFVSSSGLDNEKNTTFLPQIISKWVEVTNSGDELIWEYIVKRLIHKSPDEAEYSWRPFEGLRCQRRMFCKDNFLQERFTRSDKLLNTAISFLETWKSRSQYGRALSHLLKKTSWQVKHSKDVAVSIDDIAFLLFEVEQSIENRALTQDLWWRENVRGLLDSKEDAIAYFAIQACNKNISQNLPEIEYCLTNQKLMLESRLTDELGLLMSNSYCYLSSNVQVKTQELIVDYCLSSANDEELKNIQLYSGYRLLRWVPTFVRIQQTQSLIEQCQRKFGYEKLGPRVYLRSISGGSPVKVNDISRLSDSLILKFLAYYGEAENTSLNDSSFITDSYSTAFTISELSTIDPVRFLGFSTALKKGNIAQNYLAAILDGASKHLRQRFKDSDPEKIACMVQPLLDEKLVLKKIIGILESSPALFKNQQSKVASILEDCCSVVLDETLAERLTLLLYWILSINRSFPYLEAQENLDGSRINSENFSLRTVAQSAITLYNRLIEHDLNPSSLLATLVSQLSQHGDSNINVQILSGLPYTIHKKSSFGWQLLRKMFEKDNTLEWGEAERVFYYNYDKNFLRIKPYLCRIEEEITEQNGEVWGRICALSSLSGHITQSDLFNSLNSLNNSAAKGVVQVFTTNLEKSEFESDCKAGLSRLLRSFPSSIEVLEEIDRCFSTEKTLDVDFDFATLFLDACSRAPESIDLLIFPEWLAAQSRWNPYATLTLLENLVVHMNVENSSIYTHCTRELIKALLEIEREADDSDDPDMIRRTIALQDQFLEMDLYGMDALFDSSARS